MQQGGAERLRADRRGNLLTISAVALGILLVVTSVAMVTDESARQVVPADADDGTDIVATGVESELADSSLNGSDEADDRVPGPAIGRSGWVTDDIPANASVPAVARRAVENTFNGSIDNATERDITTLLSSIARQQRTTGEMTTIEPAGAGVTYGLSVVLGDAQRDAKFDSGAANNISTAALEARSNSTSEAQSDGAAVLAAELTPTDGQYLLLGGAAGLRDSTIRFVTDSLPSNRTEAVTLTAVPAGQPVTRGDTWELRAYRAPDGAAVVSIDGETVRQTEETTAVDIGAMTVDGESLDAESPSAAFQPRFDLSIRNGSEVYGAFSLFSTTPADTEMRSVETVAVSREIANATFDVTFQTGRTTYTDTMTVQPERDPIEDIVLQEPDSGRPPEAAFTIESISRNKSQIIYRIDASQSTGENPANGYDWDVTDHASRVSGSIDDKIAQNVTVDREESDYYLPISLTVTDGSGLEDTHQNGTVVPGTTGGDGPSANADLSVVRVDETAVTVRARAVDHTDTSRFDFQWTPVSGASRVASVERRNEEQTVLYTIERQPRDVTFAAELELTRQNSGVSDTDIDDVVIPALSTAVASPLEVNISEQGRTRSQLTYQVSVSGSLTETISWSALRYQSRVNGLSDGPVSQTITVNRASSDYTLAVEGTEDRPSGDVSDSATVTVPAESTDGTNGPDADIKTSQLSGDSSTETWTFDGNESTPSSEITSYDWIILDKNNAVTVDQRNGDKLRLTIDRPADGTRDVPVELTVETDAGLTDTVQTTVTIDARDSGGQDPLNAPVADIEIDSVRANADNYLVSLDGTNSRDYDGTIVDYDWTITDSSIVVDAPENGQARTDVSIQPPANQPVTIKLTVEDDDGLTDTATLERSFSGYRGNQPPEARLSSDRVRTINGTVKEFALDATNTSDPDGQITQLNYDVLVENGELLDPIWDGREQQTVRVRVVEDTPDVTVKLTATDDDGSTDTATTNLEGEPEDNNPLRFVRAGTSPTNPQQGEQSDVVFETTRPASVTAYVDGKRTGVTRTEDFIGLEYVGSVQHRFRSGGTKTIRLVARSGSEKAVTEFEVDINRAPKLTSVSQDGSIGTWTFDWLSSNSFDHYYSAGLETAAKDPDGDSYSISVSGRHGACAEEAFSGCTRGTASDLTGYERLDWRVPLNQHNANNNANPQTVTVTATDEHGASTSRQVYLGPKVDLKISLESGIGDGETVRIPTDEQANLDLSYAPQINTQTSINQWQNRVWTIEVYDPSGDLVYYDSDGDTDADHETGYGNPPTIEAQPGEEGQYTVTADYRIWDADLPDSSASTVLHFTVERYDPSPPDDKSGNAPSGYVWSATDPGSGWVSTGETRERTEVANSRPGSEWQRTGTFTEKTDEQTVNFGGAPNSPPDTAGSHWEQSNKVSFVYVAVRGTYEWTLIETKYRGTTADSGADILG